MKPVRFAYHRPGSLAEAAELLSGAGGFAKVLAGGQSLGPMLNLRLAQPDAIVDITGIPELLGIEPAGDRLRIGACVTHADIEDRRVPDVAAGLLAAVARGIAYRAVRNRGTLGGSLAHADPAADWLAALPLLEAEAVLWSREGDRTLPVEALMTGAFTTVLRPDEILCAILLPNLSAQARWGFRKFSRKVGEFGHAIGGVLHDPERGLFRAVMGALDAAPVVVPDAARLFGGGFGADVAARLDVDAATRLLDERGVRDAYHRRLHLAMLRRAAADAANAAGARAA